MTGSKRPAFAVAVCCGAIALVGAVWMLGMKVLCGGLVQIAKPNLTFGGCVGIVGDTVDRYVYVLFLSGAVLMSLALLIGDWRKEKGSDQT